MKQLSLFIVLFHLAFTVNAQHVAISLDKENIMYIGLPNPITVAAYGCPCKNLIVEMDSATIEPLEEPCHYSVWVKTPGKNVIRLYSKSKQGKKLLGQQVYRIKRIPDPVARIGGKSNDTIRRNILAAQLGVIAQLDNFDFDYRAVVTNYTIIINREMKTIFGKTMRQAKFDDETIDYLHQLKGGDIVFVYDIKSIGPDRISRALAPIYLKVID